MQPLVVAQANLDFLRLSGPVTDPVPVFLIMTALLLVAPLFFERFRMPGIVGLLLAGVLVGPNGAGLLERDSTIVLLGTVGLLFLMFMAGLETSLDDLRARKRDSFVFGAATFLVPMVLGTLVMMALGYGLLAAVLIASCFASHTLLALPILFRLGIVRSRPALATFGATLITNVLALLVLGVVVRAHSGTLDLAFWLRLLPMLALYTVVLLAGLPVLGRWFFRHFGHDEGAEFTFVLVSLLVASYAAEMIEIEPIIGAFLAGTAISGLIPALSPLMNRIQFIGNTLFVPFFLLSVGMLVDPWLLVDSRTALVAGVMIAAVMASKLIAAWIAGRVLGFGGPTVMMLFGLTVAQAASTLAAATVGYAVGLVDEPTLNGVIAMILATCIVSPWATQKWGAAVHVGPTSAATAPTAASLLPAVERVMVPVANPDTEKELLELALLLAGARGGTLLPLNVVVDREDSVDPKGLQLQDRLLSRALSMGHAAAVKVEPVARLASSVERGILHAAFERQATLLLCGWKGYSTYQDNLFGEILDRLLRSASIPVLITRFSRPVRSVERFLMVCPEDAPPEALGAAAARVRLAARGLKAKVVMVHRESGAVPVLPPAPPDQPEEQLAYPEGQDPQEFLATAAGALDLVILLVAGPIQTRLGGIVGSLVGLLARSRPDLDLVVFYMPPAEMARRFPSPRTGD